MLKEIEGKRPSARHDNTQDKEDSSYWATRRTLEKICMFLVITQILILNG